MADDSNLGSLGDAWVSVKTDLSALKTEFGAAFAFVKEAVGGVEITATSVAGGVSAAFDSLKSKASELGHTFMEMAEHPVDGIKNLGSLVGDHLKSAIEALGPGGKIAAEGLALVAGAALAVGSAVFGLAEHAAHGGEEVLAFSQKTGIAVQNIGPMEFAAKAAGGSLDTMTGILKKLEIGAATDQGGKFAAALKDIGVNADVFKRMDSQEQLHAIAEGFQHGAASGNLMKDSVILMGKSGADSIPFLKKMTDDLVGSGKTLGVQWSSELTESSEKFGLGMGTIQTALGNIATNIGVKVLPAVSDMIDQFASSPAFIEAVTTATDYLAKGLGIAVEVVGHMTQGAIDLLAPVVAVGTFIGTLLVDAFKGMIGWVESAIGWFAQFGGAGDIMRTFGAVFESARDVVVNALSTMLGWLERIPGIGPKIKEAADNASKAFEGMTSTGAAVGSMSDKLGGSLLGTRDAAEKTSDAVHGLNVKHSEAADKTTDFSKKIDALTTALGLAEKNHISLSEVEKTHGTEIDALAAQAREMGTALPASIAKWETAIDDAKVAQKTADQLALAAKAVAAGYVDQAKIADDGMKAIGAKYEGLLTTTQKVQDDILIQSKDGKDRQLAVLDAKLAEEIRKLGPIPAVYETAYNNAEAKEKAAYDAGLAALDLKMAAEKTKLDHDVPDHTSAAYKLGTDKIQVEYDEQKIKLDTHMAEQKTRLGQTPIDYAKAYGDATAALQTENDNQKRIVNETQDTIVARMRAAGVSTRDDLTTTADHEKLKYEQMVASGKFGTDELAAQAKKVWGVGGAVDLATDHAVTKHQEMVDRIATASEGLIKGLIGGWQSFKDETKRLLGELMSWFEDVFVKALIGWATGSQNAWSDAIGTIKSAMGIAKTASDASKDASDAAVIDSGTAGAGWTAAAGEVALFELAAVAAYLQAKFVYEFVKAAFGPHISPGPVPAPPGGLEPGGPGNPGAPGSPPGGEQSPGSPGFEEMLAFAQQWFDAIQAAGGSQSQMQAFNDWLYTHSWIIGHGQGFDVKEGGALGPSAAFLAAGSPGAGSSVGNFVQLANGAWVPTNHPLAIAEQGGVSEPAAAAPTVGPLAAIEAKMAETLGSIMASLGSHFIGLQSTSAPAPTLASITAALASNMHFGFDPSMLGVFAPGASGSTAYDRSASLAHQTQVSIEGSDTPVVINLDGLQVGRLILRRQPEILRSWGVPT